MKDFKKRSLVLMLASVISVTGSFAADNYKNCLKNMEFKASGANGVELILNTERLYEGTISPIKRDMNTYIIMLPEVDTTAPTPNLSNAQGNISSVEVKKMPYANGSKGYTRITIKTNGNVNLTASNALYIPKKEGDPAAIEQRNDEYTVQEEREDDVRSERDTSEKSSSSKKQSSYSSVNRNSYRSDARPVNHTSSTSRYNNETENNADNNAYSEPVSEESVSQEGQTGFVNNDATYQQFMLGLLVLLIIVMSIYFYTKAQNKLGNVLGEKLEIDLDDDNKKKNPEDKKKKIRSEINKLDAKYSKTAISSSKAFQPPPQVKTPEPEELNIVDLDALFKEQAETSDSDENEALEDFLSGFSFYENAEEAEPEAEEENQFDEEVYEKVINDNAIKFNKDDIECFKELLQSEISSEVMNNISKYAVSNPIVPQKPPIEKKLADIVSDYTISGNVSFSSDDINALQKLISVELDGSFVTDLRTNPQRTAEMEKEILEASPKKSKPSEILTLKVKDMLPNLSEELKLQGNKPIVSDAKPEIVYYSEGYEVSTLTLDFDLPDLAKEVNNKNAYKNKPSEAIQVVDNSYLNSVSKLTISGLPDLDDVMAHPEKYKDEEPEEVIVDENALLNSISNVQFKPFYDGSRDIEIINNFDEEDEVADVNTSITDIKNEFSQFDNFEVAEDDNENDMPEEQTNADYDDFEAIYSNEYYNFDEPAENNEIKPKAADDATDQNINIKQKPAGKRKSSGSSEELLKMISNADSVENKTEKKEEVKENTSKPAKKSSPKISDKSSAIKCIMDGVNYDVVSTAPIDEHIGCHLAKSENGYIVFAYKDSELKIIKEYDSLKSEKIQARISETLPDGTPRYLVRIGLNKFVVDIIDGTVNYVMDLC